jgi:hypothetical protein
MCQWLVRLLAIKCRSTPLKCGASALQYMKHQRWHWKWAERMLLALARVSMRGDGDGAGVGGW